MRLCRPGQSNSGSIVPETEYFPVWFVSSLAIRPYGCVLRLPKRKNLLVSDRRFSANRTAERRGTRPRHAGAWRAEGNNADRRAVLPKKRRCPNRFVCGYGKRRTTQEAKALAPRANRIGDNSKRKNWRFMASFFGMMLLLRPAVFSVCFVFSVFLSRHRAICSSVRSITASIDTVPTPKIAVSSLPCSGSVQREAIPHIP